jgi:hypothetical protein
MSRVTYSLLRSFCLCIATSLRGVRRLHVMLVATGYMVVSYLCGTELWEYSKLMLIISMFLCLC